MQNFFQQNGQFYDRFGMAVTPKQILGIENYAPPSDPRIFQQPMQQAPSLQQIAPAVGMQPLQSRPNETAFGASRPRSAFSTGTLDFESNGPKKSPEQIQQELTKHLDKYPDDIPNFINDLNEAKIPIPDWLDNRWQDWLKEYQQKNGQIGRPQIMPQSYIPSLQQTPTLQQMTPVLGNLNNILDASRGRRF